MRRNRSTINNESRLQNNIKVNKRKVCVVITARPSYSRVKTALQAIKENNKLELQLVLAGAALLNRYGNVDDFVIEDGFKIDAKVFMVLEGENPTTMAKTTGLGVIELSNVFYNLKPDVVVVIADRFETLAVSIAAAYQNIPVAHIQGGEITGNIDEKVRHANTKLADIHLVSTESARRRVIQLGEDENYVFTTGCPSVDLAANVIDSASLGFDPFKKYGGVGDIFNYDAGYIVVMQHSVTTEYMQAAAQIEQTLQAVEELQIPAFWFWPNVDAGADGLSHGIRAYREKHALPFIHFFKNMRPEDFLKLLHHSKCLVGNSSVGIRECAYLGVPVVNIGSRQHGRDKANNVIDCGYEKNEIFAAIKSCLQQARPQPSTFYGGGNAGKNIANVLETVTLRHHKTLNYK